MKRYDHTDATLNVQSHARNSNKDHAINDAVVHKKMATITRWYSTSLLASITFAVLLSGSNASLAQPSQAGNLPIYTSPIDVTGLKLQLRVTAPDRDSGKPVEVALPVDLLGPKMNQLFSTPLSTQMDQYWNVIPDPKTGMTPRQTACDGKDGIKQQVADQVAAKGKRAYDISCTLASKGQLVVKQVGATMTLAYLLTNNTVSFASTSAQTCNSNNGSVFCPNDPRFTVHFATEIVTVVRTAGLCQIFAENGTVYVVAASFEAKNAAADVAKFLFGQDFLAGEVAMTNTVRRQPLPLDDSFKELRTSAACTGKTPGISRVLTAFRDLETVIDMRQGILLKASHSGIVAPTLDGSAPGSASTANIPSVPSFTRPMIATSQPLVTAGNTVRISGQHFPLNVGRSTSLPVTMRHGGYGPNSTILGGVCFGGATELEWGPVGGAQRVQRLPGSAQGVCAAAYDASGLTPNTAYQFRVRDCDPITCSPWSPLLRASTEKADTQKGTVLLTLDSGTAVGNAAQGRAIPNTHNTGSLGSGKVLVNTSTNVLTRPALDTRTGRATSATRGEILSALGGGTPLGSTSVDARGNFETTITIPAGTSIGAHTIHAVNGDARADVTIQVTAGGAAGKASIMMVGLLKGETGCPNHPISSTQTDSFFTLFGAGFAAGGTVAIHLDSATGSTLGTAVVRPDGSICQQISSAPSNKAGARTLVAVQSGATVAQTAVTFVLPSIVR